MKIAVDADGCPVRKIIVKVARARAIPVLMVTDTSHRVEDGYSEVLVISKGRDSADFALVNRLIPGDIVVTQDYGLATMALAKQAVVISQQGFQYTKDNIDQLLFQRFLSGKVRRSGGRGPKIKKRTKADDRKFEDLLIRLLEDSAALG